MACVSARADPEVAREWQDHAGSPYLSPSAGLDTSCSAWLTILTTVMSEASFTWRSVGKACERPNRSAPARMGSGRVVCNLRAAL